MLREVPLVLRLNAADDVVIARRQLVSGTLVKNEGVTVIGLIPPGHKLAARAIAAGKVEIILKSPELVARVVENAKALALKEYNWDHVAGRMEVEVFAKLA